MTCRAALVLALLSALALGAESPKPAEPPKPMEAPKANEAPKPAEAAKPPAAPAPKEKKMNRLAKEKSPYLLQHADNPVDWYPWGDEAFEKAKKEDKPVFVSVGYSSCHWCHVMERESFENAEVAALLNADFVSVKVDREERPDLDADFMLTLQLMTGGGGWPMSLFLTPDRKVFFAGTYFPPENVAGRPGFKHLLAAVAKQWKGKRKDVDDAADRIGRERSRLEASTFGTARGEPARATVDALLRDLSRHFDERFGGFGRAPKFPPHGALRVLLREAAARKNVDALRLSTRTLDAMAHGGIRDHLGGGFHRYSTDERWRVPHFEKMLYDNALLAGIYAESAALGKNPEHARVARETCDFLLRELALPGGAFASAIDADSAGGEGAFYLWTTDEIREILGPDDGVAFAIAYGALEEGNVGDAPGGPGGPRNVLYRPRPLEELASAFRQDPIEFRRRIDGLRAKLLEARSRRERPALDDKVLADWNALAISGLATAGRVLGEKRYTDAASACADFLLKNLRIEGRLAHMWRGGEARVDGMLEDYAFLADALLDLGEATNDPLRLAQARELADEILKRFLDPADGAFFRTAAGPDPKVVRRKEYHDGPVPSGNSIATRVLIRLAVATGEERYREAARRALQAFGGYARQMPRAAEMLVEATAMWLDGPGSKIAPGEGSDAAGREDVLAAEAFLSAARAAPGETVRLAFRIAPDPGYHLQANDPKDKTALAVLDVKPDAGIAAGPVRAPKPSEAVLGGEKIPIHEGGSTFRADLEIAKDAAPGKRRILLAFKFQACNDKSCRLPATLSLEVPLEIVAKPQGDKPRHPEVFKEP